MLTTRGGLHSCTTKSMLCDFWTLLNVRFVKQTSIHAPLGRHYLVNPRFSRNPNHVCTTLFPTCLSNVGHSESIPFHTYLSFLKLSAKPQCGHVPRMHTRTNTTVKYRHEQTLQLTTDQPSRRRNNLKRTHEGLFLCCGCRWSRGGGEYPSGTWRNTGDYATPPLSRCVNSYGIHARHRWLPASLTALPNHVHLIS